MSFWKYIIAVIVVTGAFSGNSSAETAQYTGTMKILATSGRSCGKLAEKTYPLTLILNRQKNGEISGFFESEAITFGKFSGHYLMAIPVTYPYHDLERSSGHTISMVENGASLVVTLHDRHIAPELDECNFDHAVMKLEKNSRIKQLESTLGILSTRFEAQRIRSEAIDLSRRGQLYDAVLNYEKALKLIDQVYPAGSFYSDSFSAALAGGYIKSDMSDEFVKFYDQRFSLVKDEAVRAVFNEYRMRIYKKNARTAMQREDFDTVIKNYQQVMVLNPQDKAAIGGIMSAYMRSERYDNAIAFLEQSESRLQNKEDKVDIRGATAMALLKQSVKFDQSGKIPEAERALKRAMEFDPGSVVYTVALARLRHKYGNLVDAEKILSQAELHFKDLNSKIIIAMGREKMHQVDAILRKINGAGS